MTHIFAKFKALVAHKSHSHAHKSNTTNNNTAISHPSTHNISPPVEPDTPQVEPTTPSLVAFVTYTVERLARLFDRIHYIKMSDTSGEVRWSHEADGLLCMMKASENNSDEVIAGMLTRTEDEVQRRTEHLSGIAADAGLTIKNLADIYKEEVKRTRTYKEYLKTFEAMSSNLDRHATLEQQLDLPAMANKKIQERLSEKERKSGRPSKGKEIFGIGWDEDEGAGLEVQVRYDAEQPAQEFNNVVPAALDENSPSDLDWDAASPDHDGNDGSPEYDSSPEGSPPRADFLDVLEDMYPRHKEIPSDDFFSERDCKAISLFEARYRADKWLKIAADFANATGRSVEPEILRAKFKKA